MSIVLQSFHPADDRGGFWTWPADPIKVLFKDGSGRVVFGFKPVSVRCPVCVNWWKSGEQWVGSSRPCPYKEHSEDVKAFVQVDGCTAEVVPHYHRCNDPGDQKPYGYTLIFQRCAEPYAFYSKGEAHE